RQGDVDDRAVSWHDAGRLLGPCQVGGKSLAAPIEVAEIRAVRPRIEVDERSAELEVPDEYLADRIAQRGRHDGKRQHSHQGAGTGDHLAEAESDPYRHAGETQRANQGH